ncbi:MAG TPA: BlaI/MecI/CopY family transcriptional regulator [Bryobacteraceae bacterium]|jgi:predicted transcriptional regulator
MPRTVRDIPPPLEMLCLKALWALGEGNVSEIREIVGRSRALAYTTIMTVLERLVRKGKLTRRKVGRAYVYSLQVSMENMRRAAVRELVDGLFDGSEEELIRFLSGSDRAITVKQTVAEEAPIDTVLL